MGPRTPAKYRSAASLYTVVVPTSSGSSACVPASLIDPEGHECNANDRPQYQGPSGEQDRSQPREPVYSCLQPGPERSGHDTLTRFLPPVIRSRPPKRGHCRVEGIGASRRR